MFQAVFWCLYWRVLGHRLTSEAGSTFHYAVTEITSLNVISFSTSRSINLVVCPCFCTKCIKWMHNGEAVCPASCFISETRERFLKWNLTLVCAVKCVKRYIGQNNPYYLAWTLCRRYHLPQKYIFLRKTWNVVRTRDTDVTYNFHSNELL
jgi:hypothetical protein